MCEKPTLLMYQERWVSRGVSAFSRVFHHSDLWAWWGRIPSHHSCLACCRELFGPFPVSSSFSVKLAPALLRYWGLCPNVHTLFSLPRSSCHIFPRREWHWDDANIRRTCFLIGGDIPIAESSFLTHKAQMYTLGKQMCSMALLLPLPGGWVGKEKGALWRGW